MNPTLLARSRIASAVAELAVSDTGVLPVAIVSQAIVEDAQDLIHRTAEILGYRVVDLMATGFKNADVIHGGTEASDEILSRIAGDGPCLVMIDATDGAEDVIAEFTCMVDMEYDGENALLFYTGGDVFEVARIVGKTLGRDPTRFIL